MANSADDTRGFEKKLDKDFLYYLNLTKKLYDNVKNETEKQLCEVWLNHLVGKNAETVTEKCDRNIFLSRLLLQMQNGKLQTIFLDTPPSGPLPSAFATFDLPLEVEGVKAFEEMGFQVDKSFGGSGDFFEASRDGRSYIATKRLPEGMMAFMAVTNNEGEDIWIPQEIPKILPPCPPPMTGITSTNISNFAGLSCPPVPLGLPSPLRSGVSGPSGLGVPGPSGFGVPGPTGFGVPGPSGIGVPGPSGFGVPGPTGLAPLRGPSPGPALPLPPRPSRHPPPLGGQPQDGSSCPPGLSPPLRSQPQDLNPSCPPGPSGVKGSPPGLGIPPPLRSQPQDLNPSCPPGPSGVKGPPGLVPGGVSPPLRGQPQDLGASCPSGSSGVKGPSPGLAPPSSSHPPPDPCPRGQTVDPCSLTQNFRAISPGRGPPMTSGPQYPPISGTPQDPNLLQSGSPGTSAQSSRVSRRTPSPVGAPAPTPVIHVHPPTPPLHTNVSPQEICPSEVPYPPCPVVGQSPGPDASCNTGVTGYAPSFNEAVVSGTGANYPPFESSPAPPATHAGRPGYGARPPGQKVKPPSQGSRPNSPGSRPPSQGGRHGARSGHGASPPPPTQGRGTKAPGRRGGPQVQGVGQPPCPTTTYTAVPGQEVEAPFTAPPNIRAQYSPFGPEVPYDDPNIEYSPEAPRPQRNIQCVPAPHFQGQPQPQLQSPQAQYSQAQNVPVQPYQYDQAQYVSNVQVQDYNQMENTVPVEKHGGPAFTKKLLQLFGAPLEQVRKQLADRHRLIAWIDKMVTDCNRWIIGEDPHNADLERLFEMLYNDYELEEDKKELFKHPKRLRTILMKDIRDILLYKRYEIVKREVTLDQIQNEQNEYLGKPEKNKKMNIQLDEAWIHSAKRPLSDAVRVSLNSNYPEEVVQRFFELLVEERIELIDKGEKEARRRVNELKAASQDDIKEAYAKFKRAKDEYKEYYEMFQVIEKWENEFRRQAKEKGASASREKEEAISQTHERQKADMEYEIEQARRKFERERRLHSELTDKIEQTKNEYNKTADSMKNESSKICSDRRKVNLQKEQLLAKIEVLKKKRDSMRQGHSSKNTSTGAKPKRRLF